MLPDLHVTGPSRRAGAGRWLSGLLASAAQATARLCAAGARAAYGPAADCARPPPSGGRDAPRAPAVPAPVQLVPLSAAMRRLMAGAPPSAGPRAGRQGPGELDGGAGRGSSAGADARGRQPAAGQPDPGGRGAAAVSPGAGAPLPEELWAAFVQQWRVLIAPAPGPDQPANPEPVVVPIPRGAGPPDAARWAAVCAAWAAPGLRALTLGAIADAGAAAQDAALLASALVCARAGGLDCGGAAPAAAPAAGAAPQPPALRADMHGGSCGSAGGGVGARASAALRARLRSAAQRQLALLAPGARARAAALLSRPASAGGLLVRLPGGAAAAGAGAEPGSIGSSQTCLAAVPDGARATSSSSAPCGASAAAAAPAAEQRGCGGAAAAVAAGSAAQQGLVEAAAGACEARAAGPGGGGRGRGRGARGRAGWQTRRGRRGRGPGGGRQLASGSPACADVAATEAPSPPGHLDRGATAAAEAHAPQLEAPTGLGPGAGGGAAQRGLARAAASSPAAPRPAAQERGAGAAGEPARRGGTPEGYGARVGLDGPPSARPQRRRRAGAYHAREIARSTWCAARQAAGRGSAPGLPSRGRGRGRGRGPGGRAFRDLTADLAAALCAVADPEPTAQDEGAAGAAGRRPTALSGIEPAPAGTAAAAGFSIRAACAAVARAAAGRPEAAAGGECSGALARAAAVDRCSDTDCEQALLGRLTAAVSEC